MQLIAPIEQSQSKTAETSRPASQSALDFETDPNKKSLAEPRLSTKLEDSPETPARQW
jgi:hypothetical protein